MEKSGKYLRTRITWEAYLSFIIEFKQNIEKS